MTMYTGEGIGYQWLVGMRRFEGRGVKTQSIVNVHILALYSVGSVMRMYDLNKPIGLASRSQLGSRKRRVCCASCRQYDCDGKPNGS